MAIAIKILKSHQIERHSFGVETGGMETRTHTKRDRRVHRSTLVMQIREMENMKSILISLPKSFHLINESKGNGRNCTYIQKLLGKNGKENSKSIYHKTRQ